jgi:hypothetical protein
MLCISAFANLHAQNSTSIGSAVFRHSLLAQQHNTSSAASEQTDHLDCSSCKRKLEYIKMCKIWNFYGGNYEECRRLGYYARVSLRTDVSEELSAFIIRETRIGELGAT